MIERLYRLTEIIGDRRRGIPGIMPMSESAWMRGVKEGKFPKSVRLNQRTVAWRESDLSALQKQLFGGESQQQKTEN